MKIEVHDNDVENADQFADGANDRDDSIHHDDD